MNNVNSEVQLMTHLFTNTKALIFLGFLAHSSASMSAPGDFMPNARPVENIIVEGDSTGKATIVIQGGVPSSYIPPECNSQYNTIDLSTSKGKGQFAAVLTAYTTGKPVKLALQCIGDRPLITHIMF